MKTLLHDRARRHGPAGAAAALLLVACTMADPPLEGDVLRNLTGYAQFECGPADGPAVDIVLTANLPAGGDPRARIDSLAAVGNEPATTSTDEPVLRIAIWEPASRLPGQRRDLPGADAMGGHVQLCRAGAGCTPVAGTFLRFDRTAPDALAGRYRITRPDGLVQAGRFRTQWVERTIYCG